MLKVSSIQLLDRPSLAKKWPSLRSAPSTGPFVLDATEMAVMLEVSSIQLLDRPSLAKKWPSLRSAPSTGPFVLDATEMAVMLEVSSIQLLDRPSLAKKWPSLRSAPSTGATGGGGGGATGECVSRYSMGCTKPFGSGYEPHGIAPHPLVEEDGGTPAPG